MKKSSKPTTTPDENKLPPKIQEPVAKTEVTNESKKQEVQTKPEPEKTKSTAKTDEIDLKKSKAKQLAALKAIKKTSAIDKIKQSLKAESISKIKNQSKAMGNGAKVIAAGTTLTGLDKLDADNYLVAVDQSVKKQWALPQWLMNKPYKTKLLLKLDKQGQIISLKVISPSGNSSYDNYCVQAVEKAAPFPEVPEKLSEKFSADGVIVGFPE